MSTQSDIMKWIKALFQPTSWYLVVLFDSKQTDTRTDITK